MNPGMVVLLVALLVGAVLVQRARLGGAPREDIKEMIAAGAAVIDVRTQDEFAGGHYPNASNVPLAEIASETGIARIGEIVPSKSAPVVLYCRTGTRSAQALTHLKRAGYTSIVNGGGLHSMP